MLASKYTLSWKFLAFSSVRFVFRGKKKNFIPKSETHVLSPCSVSVFHSLSLAQIAFSCAHILNYKSTLCVLNCISTFETKAIKSDLKRTNSFSQRCVHFIFSLTSTRFFSLCIISVKNLFGSSFKTSFYYIYEITQWMLLPSLWLSTLSSLFCTQYTCNHAKLWWREKKTLWKNDLRQISHDFL